MVSRRALSILRDLLTAEATGGLILMAAAVLALLIANSPAAPLYLRALDLHLAGLSMFHWINDGLMALFLSCCSRPC